MFKLVVMYNFSQLAVSYVFFTIISETTDLSECMFGNVHILHKDIATNVRIALNSNYNNFLCIYHRKFKPFQIIQLKLL